MEFFVIAKNGRFQITKERYQSLLGHWKTNNQNLWTRNSKYCTVYLNTEFIN